MNSIISPPLTTEGDAYLLLKLDGIQTQIQEEAERLKRLCREMKVREIRVIEDEKEAASYWEARTMLYPLALTYLKRLISEDVTIPRDRIPEFARSVAEIALETGTMLGLGGHAGDGNMHPSISFLEINDEEERKAMAAIRKVVACGLSYGGSISGEHGVGLHKAEFIVDELGQRQVDLMKTIKNAIDPSGIMNPGKLWV